MARIPHIQGAAVISVLLMSSCQRPVSTEGVGGTRMRDGAAHAVHSDQLHAIMKGLDAEVGKTWPQEIAEERAADAQRDRRARLQRVAGLARILADSARQIPAAAADASLSEADRTTFLAFARQLGTQAEELRVAAEARTVRQAEVCLERISGTCNACHSQFADLAGPVSLGAARR